MMLAVCFLCVLIVTFTWVMLATHAPIQPPSHLGRSEGEKEGRRDRPVEQVLE